MVALVALPPAPDVDVSVPPGSPLDWGRAFPAITPAAGDLFPRSRTPDAASGGEQAPPRTKVLAQRPRLDIRFSSSFDLTRIMTFDIVMELDWIETRPASRRTGRSSALPPQPVAGDPLYWTTLVAMLRLLLHPSETPRNEIETHLIEVGEAAMPAVESARGQPYLRKTVAAVEGKVTPRNDRAPGPLTAADPYEAMLLRFVYEELTAAHPYDPIGTFGRRLFLFRERFEPQVLSYTAHENAYLRRAAVSALGRYPTMSAARAQLGLAVTSEDPVVVTRALAGLGRGRRRVDVAPLLKLLAETHDTHERTALVGALGRLGAAQAVPVLIEEGHGALDRGDSDLLVTILTALAKLPASRPEELTAFTQRTIDLALRKPMTMQPSQGLSNVQADRADGPHRRALALRQLAMIVAARTDPFDPERQRAMLGLVNQPPRDPLDPGAAWLNGVSLARLEAPAQLVYLDLLGLMGTAGEGPLVRTARDPSQDAGARGHALTRLASGARVEQVRALMGRGSPTLRIHAFHLANRDLHPELVDYAREELARGAAQLPGQGAPEQRHLTLEALRVLDARRLLRTEDVLPLLYHAEAPQHAFADLPDRVRREVAELVLRARRGLSRSALNREAKRLVQLVIDEGLRPDLVKTRQATVAEVAKQLGSATARSGDVVYLEVLSRDLEEQLLGFPVPRWSRERGEFQPPVLLEEEILLTLGRTATDEAVEALSAFLQNRRNRLRSVACLALGMSAGDSRERAARATRELAPFLLDPEPFTRWCAYSSIEHLAGIEERIDWMYAPEPERYAAAQRVWKLLMTPR